MAKVDIIITSYNGKELLKKHLPRVIKNSGRVNKIYVYDDAGSDDTEDFLKKNYPDIIFTRNQTNLGFTKNTNLAVKNSKADYVVLLNNDVSPLKDYLKNALKYFSQSPDLFAVTLSEAEHSWPDVTLNDSQVNFSEGKDKTKPRFSLWASGGSAVISKKIWNKLGGFYSIYSPGYWEDIDMGWRAWSQGYMTIWAPDAKVNHQHESTFKTLNQNKLSLIKQRNEIICNLLNLDNISLYITHLLLRTIKNPGYIKVIFKLLPYLPEVASLRSKNIKNKKLSSNQIASKINKPL